MIDIIVLADGTLEDLKQTLFSIAYQDSSELVNVYLMNNKKTKSFKDLVSYFMNFINIKELECFSCKSLCEIKQYGIDNSTNDYIMFMESGSMLEGNIVIKNIIKYLYFPFDNLPAVIWQPDVFGDLLSSSVSPSLIFFLLLI